MRSAKKTDFPFQADTQALVRLNPRKKEPTINLVSQNKIRLGISLKGRFSRTPLTRTPKGNEKQFELAEFKITGLVLIFKYPISY